MGRWASTDPAEQFWDRYAYAGNEYNPINATDPSGNMILVIYTDPKKELPKPRELENPYAEASFDLLGDITMVGLKSLAILQVGYLGTALLGKPAFLFGLKTIMSPWGAGSIYLSARTPLGQYLASSFLIGCQYLAHYATAPAQYATPYLQYGPAIGQFVEGFGVEGPSTSITGTVGLLTSKAGQIYEESMWYLEDAKKSLGD